MSLRDVMAYLQKHRCAGVTATAETSAEKVTLQAKPNAHAGCTPATAATSVFNDAELNAQKTGPGEAPAAPMPTPAPAPELPDWRTLDKAYLAHHTHCHICQAAGRGARYGLRCGVGAALWTAYDAAANTPGVLPWQQKGQRHE